METDPRRWLAVLEASQDRLRALVAPLSPAQLREPSYDPGWIVAQVLSHLGSQAEIFQMYLDAVLDGAAPPRNEIFPPVWDRWNLRTPEEMARDCIAANDAFIGFLARQSDELLARPMSLFGMDLVVGDLARLRVSEHATHSWDIAVAFDPRAEIAPDAVALLIDGLPPLVTRVGKPQGRSFDLHIHTTAPERDFMLVVRDRVTLRTSGPDVDGPALGLPAEALVRLVSGRLDAGHTPPTTLVATEVTLDHLRQIFPGF